MASLDVDIVASLLAHSQLTLPRRPAKYLNSLLLTDLKKNSRYTKPLWLHEIFFFRWGREGGRRGLIPHLLSHPSRLRPSLQV